MKNYAAEMLEAYDKVMEAAEEAEIERVLEIEAEDRAIAYYEEKEA